MTALADRAALDALWTSWTARPEGDAGDALRALLAQGGTHLSERAMRFALAGARPEELTEADFADRMVPLLGGPDLKVAHAFSHVSPAGALVTATPITTLTGRACRRLLGSSARSAAGVCAAGFTPRST